MTSMKALIITGGDVDENFAFDRHKYELVIAVDGGLKSADKMGIVPDVILGDFDTVSHDLLKRYEALGKAQVITLNPEKDDTDTQAAVLYAIKQGVTKIDLLGGTGSRLDHTFANLFLMKQAYEQGVELTFYTELSKIYLIHKEKCYYPKENIYGRYISFLQFDGSAKGVTLEGFKYALENFDFDTEKTYRLGVSNEFAKDADTARITIREGYMLAVESVEDK